MLFKQLVIAAVIAPLFAALPVNADPSSVQQTIKERIEAARANNESNSKFASTTDWIDTARSRTLPIKIYKPRSAAPYPVIIFSHGLGGSRDSASYFGLAMAENGYLVISVQHPGSDDSVWMAALSQPGGDKRQKMMQDLHQAANAENLRLRIDDIKFVISELARINEADGVWHHEIDLTKIGCSGHSFGAGTTMAIAGQNYGFGDKKVLAADNRIKAALYMSPPVNLAGRDPKVVYGSIKIPGMVMTGTEDNSPINNNTAADRLIPFDNIVAPDQYLVNFNGADHMVFGGGNFRSSSDRDETKDAQFHVLINKLSLAFFDAYLKGDLKQKQWLKESAAKYLGKQAEFKSK